MLDPNSTSFTRQRAGMADSMRHERRLSFPLKTTPSNAGSSWLPGLNVAMQLCVLLGLTAGPGAATMVQGQQPQFGQGFSRAGQAAPRDPAESAAYSAAISQADPGARMSAIQQFLLAYPNSPLRQAAIAQMMTAKRDAHEPLAGAPAPYRPTGPAAAAAMPAAPAPAAAPAAVAPPVAAQPAGPPRDSLLQHPPTAANVTLTSGSLTVKADNSTLSQILHDVSSSTGMQVEGLSKDERIFGTYGPGAPREVLLSLLEGSGYNVLMVGDAHGAPRELTLSPRIAASQAASAPASTPHAEEEDEVEQEVQQTPPAEQPPPPSGAVNPNGQPRGPAEMQQEIQRLRQQQQQPQPPQ